jgi:tetratricopeptide (TPR) repeat protein
MRKIQLIKLALSVLVAVACLFNWFCSSEKKVDDPFKRTAYANLSDTVKYVGMETCKGCHTGIHSTFIHTGMGLSFDAATKQKSSADFSNHPVVYDQYKNLSYTPYWENDSLYFLEYRLEGADTIYQRREKVKYIVGSGQHTNSHIWESNGYLYQAPMTFYTQKQKWDLPPGFEDGNNTRFNRIIGLECMSCHNGYPKFDEGSENKYSFVKNGIDCERCHGPGSLHVREKSSGILIDTANSIDYSIVNPSKLPIDLQFDVCQRCHVQGNAVLNEGKSFFDFKPGMKLSSVMNVYMPIYEGNSSAHIMASHAERLKQSKCFIETMKKVNAQPNSSNLALKPYKNALTCITCHNPHVSVKETNKDVFNATCRSCHSDSKKPDCSLSLDKRNLKNNNCVSCHMPFNGATDIPHVSVHDHRIAVPLENKEIENIKKFIGITAINNPNPPRESKAQAYINYFEKFGMGPAMLDSALYYLKENGKIDINKNITKLIHIYYLKNEYATVIKFVDQTKSLKDKLKVKQFDNYYAWTAYRVGECYQQIENNSIAKQYFEIAYLQAPLIPDFANKYASALASSGDYSNARKIYLTIIKLQPKYAPAYCNLGYLVLVADKNTALAMSYYDRALALDPDYEVALSNKVALLAFKGDKQNAVKMLNRLLKRNPSNVQAKELLKSLNTIQ